MDTIYFKQNKVQLIDFDFVDEFKKLLNEYKSKNCPVVLFRRPLIKENPKSLTPFLTYEDVEAMSYTFYGKGFKAVLITYSSLCDLAEFEEQQLKDITLVDYTTIEIE